MPTHAEKKRLPYTQEQLFALVADVRKYPEFLPWCRSARITKEEGDVFYADLVIGYKLFQESFSSRVHLSAPDAIRVDYLRGPMKRLSNEWHFLPEPDGTCTIDFFVDFEFRNRLFQGLMEVFFNEITRRMVSAFENRARELYRPLVDS